MEKLTFDDKTITFFGEGDELVFLPALEDEGEEIFSRLKNNCRLAVISGFDWNRDLSPWAAKAAFRRGGDFSGGAEEFLSRLLPAAETAKKLCGAKRCFIAGYSLAGLFSLWSVTKVDFFDGAASVSGSLWFDGFREYLEKSRISASKIYLSLGDREKCARDERLAAVEDCTRRAFEIIKSRGIDSVFELNPGGHFNEPESRVALAIDWLTR